MNMKAFFLVGLGGAAGSMARYAINILLGRVVSVPFPFATLGVNLGGCLLIGLLFGYALRSGTSLQHDLMLLLATGFCGGFTTFSSFAIENVTLFQKGQSSMAFLYSGLSIIAGLLMCRLGLWLTS